MDRRPMRKRGKKRRRKGRDGEKGNKKAEARPALFITINYPGGQSRGRRGKKHRDNQATDCKRIGVEVDPDTFSFVNPPGDERRNYKTRGKAKKKQEIRSGRASGEFSA